MCSSRLDKAQNLARAIAEIVRLALRNTDVPDPSRSLLGRALDELQELDSHLTQLCQQTWRPQQEVKLKSPPCIAQIADTHYGLRHAAGRQSVDAELLADWSGLGNESPAVPVPSVAVHCGDLADSGHPREYSDAVEMLRRLKSGMRYLARGHPVDVLAVPGNHDVSHPLTRGLESDPGCADPYVNDPLYKYRLAPFSDALEELVTGLSWELPYWRAYESPAGTLVIVALNSCEQEDHKSHLGWIDTQKSADTLAQIRKEYPEALLVLAWHHPPFGQRGEPGYIHNFADVLTLLEEYEVAICLHGHLHTFDEIAVMRGNTRPVQLIGAGSISVAASERPQEDQRGPHLLEYNIIEFRSLARTTFEARLHAREYRPGDPGRWGPAPRFKDNSSWKPLSIDG